jgi:hypothetical protein
MHATAPQCRCSRLSQKKIAAEGRRPHALRLLRLRLLLWARPLARRRQRAAGAPCARRASAARAWLSPDSGSAVVAPTSCARLQPISADASCSPHLCAPPQLGPSCLFPTSCFSRRARPWSNAATHLARPRARRCAPARRGPRSAHARARPSWRCAPLALGNRSRVGSGAGAGIDAGAGEGADPGNNNGSEEAEVGSGWLCRMVGWIGLGALPCVCLYIYIYIYTLGVESYSTPNSHHWPNCVKNYWNKSRDYWPVSMVQ